MKNLDIRDLLASHMSTDSSRIFSNTIDRSTDKSIGVFTAPEARMTDTKTFGGDELAPTKKYPVNVLVRWTTDSDTCEMKAAQVYSIFKGMGQNFYIIPGNILSTKIAFIDLLDACPIWLGRDEKDNVCEFSIRIDIYYYN